MFYCGRLQETWAATRDTFTRAHTLSRSLFPSQTHTRTLSYTLSLSLSLLQTPTADMSSILFYYIVNYILLYSPLHFIIWSIIFYCRRLQQTLLHVRALSLYLSLSHTHAHTLSLAHTHTHSLSLSRPHAYTISLAFSLSCSLARSRARARSLSFSLIAADAYGRHVFNSILLYSQSYFTISSGW